MSDGEEEVMTDDIMGEEENKVRDPREHRLIYGNIYIRVYS